MTQPGWYPDPSGQPGKFRWWDGTKWTHEVRDARDVTGQPTATPSSAPPQGQQDTPRPGQHADAATQLLRREPAAAERQWSATVPPQKRPDGATPEEGVATPRFPQGFPPPAAGGDVRGGFVPQQAGWHPQPGPTPPAEELSVLFVPAKRRAGLTITIVTVVLLLLAGGLGGVFWYYRQRSPAEALTGRPRLVDPQYGLSIAIPEGWERPSDELIIETPGYDCPEGPKKCHSGVATIGLAAQSPTGLKGVAATMASFYVRQIADGPQNIKTPPEKLVDEQTTVAGRDAHRMRYRVRIKSGTREETIIAESVALYGPDNVPLEIFISLARDENNLPLDLIDQMVASARFERPSGGATP